MKTFKIPTFEEHVNESKIADTIQNAVDDFYSSDSDSEKRAAVKIISDLLPHNAKKVNSILDKSDAESAFDSLMEGKKVQTWESEVLNSFETDGFSVISVDTLFDKKNNELIDELGNILPWFVDSDKSLKNFWNKFHGSWNENVVFLQKKRKLYLASANSNYSDIQELKISLS